MAINATVHLWTSNGVLKTRERPAGNAATGEALLHIDRKGKRSAQGGGRSAPCARRCAMAAQYFCLKVSRARVRVCVGASSVFDVFSVAAVHTTRRQQLKCPGKECAKAFGSSRFLQCGCHATPAAAHIRYRLMR